jgi:ribulose-phosphate 3-epimerase
MMARKILIAPSILSADFAVLGEQIRQAEEAGADVIHVDVMDGQFVPNITIGPGVVSAIKGSTKLPLDVHLMIENPERYIEDFARAGSDYLSIHIEASGNLEHTIEKIKSLGLKAAVAVNPETDICIVSGILRELDMIIVMSVHPGFGGQPFIPESTGKLKTLRGMIAEQELDLDVEVDGGIGAENAAEVIEAGANILVVGAAVFKNRQKNISEAIKELKGIVSSL